MGICIKENRFGTWMSRQLLSTGSLTSAMDPLFPWQLQDEVLTPNKASVS